MLDAVRIGMKCLAGVALLCAGACARRTIDLSASDVCGLWVADPRVVEQLMREDGCTSSAAPPQFFVLATNRDCYWQTLAESSPGRTGCRWLESYRIGTSFREAAVLRASGYTEAAAAVGQGPWPADAFMGERYRNVTTKWTLRSPSLGGARIVRADADAAIEVLRFTNGVAVSSFILEVVTGAGGEIQLRFPVIAGDRCRRLLYHKQGHPAGSEVSRQPGSRETARKAGSAFRAADQAPRTAASAAA